MLGQDSVRDFVDVRDVVSAYRCLIDASLDEQIFNVCTGRPTAISTVVQTALDIIGLDREIHFAEQVVSGDDTSFLVGDATRLREATGWESRIELSDSIADMMAGDSLA